LIIIIITRSIGGNTGVSYVIYIYLQCTTIGPASGDCDERNRRMNMSRGVAYSGTPWSGHAMNCSWRTSLRSEQPSYITPAKHGICWTHGINTKLSTS